MAKAMQKEAVPRRGGARRIVVLVVVVLALAALGLGAWMWIGRAAVDRQIERIRAAGEPVTLDDLAPPPAAEDGDAAEHYRAALEALGPERLSAEQRRSIEHLWSALARDAAPGEEEVRMVADLVGRHAQALSLLDRATAVEECRPFITAETPLDTSMAPGQLARLVMARAVLRLHEGDPAAAVESTFAAVKLRRIFGWTPLVSHMTRIACLHMAARSGGLLATSPDVSEADLQRLMALLEEADEPESVRRALLGERVVGMAMLGITPGAQRLPGAAPGALPPLARGMVAGMYMRFMAESLEAAEQPFPQVLDAITQVRGRGLYKSLAPAGFPGVAMSTARTDALLRAARVAIACELYRREHGQPPEALSDLVPAFVPAVPLDPFDGRPLRYQRAGRTVLLYSVDENRTDDGGAIEAPSGHEPVDRGLRLTLP